MIQKASCNQAGHFRIEAREGFMVSKHAVCVGCMLLLLLAAYPRQAFSSQEQSYTVITAPEVKNMLLKGDALLVHVLSKLEYEMQHIAGSINIPFDEIATTGKLPIDKSTPIIIYCMGNK